MRPEIRFRSEQEICAVWGAVIIRICDGVRTEVEDLERVERLIDELVASYGAAGVLLVITHETPLPTPAAQRYAMTSMMRWGERFTTVIAALGLGFWAAMLRASVDVVMRVIRMHNVAVEGTVEAAAARLANQLIGIDPGALLDVYQGLRRELDEQRSPPPDRSTTAS